MRYYTQKPVLKRRGLRKSCCGGERNLNERYSKTRRVRGKTDVAVADTFSTCTLLTAGHKYYSRVLRKVFSSETNARSDNSARGATTVGGEPGSGRRYAVVSPRRAAPTDRSLVRSRPAGGGVSVLMKPQFIYINGSTPLRRILDTFACKETRL